MEATLDQLEISKYPAYKHSGAEWLGIIPSEWEVTRVKNVFRLVIEPAPKNNDFELLSVYTDIGVKPRRELEERGNKASTTDGYWFVKKGDVVVNKLLAWMGAIGVSNYDGVTSPAYDILRPKARINSIFYHYLFRNSACISEMRKHSRGIMDMRLRLYFDKFGDIKIPFPPLQTQNQIVKYLDKKTSAIDQAIQIKEKQIALLKERRQILIHQAVTRGLDPTIKLKDSGVEWIGMIPEHWEVRPLRFLGFTQNGISKGGDYFGSGFPFVSYGDVYNNTQLPQQVSGFANSSEFDQSQYSVVEGDVFFTRTSETVEEIGFASTCLATIPQATFSGFLIRFRPNKGKLFSGFSKYYFSSYTHRNFFVKEMNLVIRASLSQDLLKKMPVLLPPLEEQEQIGLFIDTANSKINSSISLKEREIEKLKEYKATLINSAVTGKIKVG